MGQYYTRDELINGIWDLDLNNHPENIFNFISSGYECEIKRNEMTWTYCGYVQLPINHPDFNKGYDDDIDISVHGGLTYSINGKFGFDCAHYSFDGDIIPGYQTFVKTRKDIFKDNNNFQSGGHYWTFEEVKKEVEFLALQFKDRSKCN